MSFELTIECNTCDNVQKFETKEKLIKKQISYDNYIYNKLY